MKLKLHNTDTNETIEIEPKEFNFIVVCDTDTEDDYNVFATYTKNAFEDGEEDRTVFLYEANFKRDFYPEDMPEKDIQDHFLASTIRSALISIGIKGEDSLSRLTEISFMDNKMDIDGIFEMYSEMVENKTA